MLHEGHMRHAPKAENSCQPIGPPTALTPENSAMLRAAQILREYSEEDILLQSLENNETVLHTIPFIEYKGDRMHSYRVILFSEDDMCELEQAQDVFEIRQKKTVRKALCDFPAIGIITIAELVINDLRKGFSESRGISIYLI